MSPRSNAPGDARTVTIAIPLDAIGPVTVTAPPPALVSTDCGAEHVGCTPAALAEHLRWMVRHPRWRERVIEASRKRRLAVPADVIDSMRERYTARPAVEAAPEDEIGALQRELEAELGIVDAPAPASASRRRSRRTR